MKHVILVVMLLVSASAMAGKKEMQQICVNTAEMTYGFQEMKEQGFSKKEAFYAVYSGMSEVLDSNAQMMKLTKDALDLAYMVSWSKEETLKRMLEECEIQFK